jgi:hypothetical protein
MDIQQFIQQSIDGNVVQAKDTLNAALSSRAFEALDAKKKEIASTLYGQGENTEDEETTEEE